MMRRMLLAAGILLAVLIGFALLLAASESRFLYYPQRRLDSSPKDWNLEAEELAVDTEDGARLRGWWIRGRGETVLVYFHGNAGNASHRLERTRDLVRDLGLDVVLVDYRGYGASSGTPSEAGLYRDADAIVRAVEKRGIGPERLVLFGESLGGAVALEAAMRHACRAVILEAPFLSIPEMARHVFPFLPPFLVRTRFDNASRIARLATPKLIVQAERDEVVPPSQTRRLFEAAAPPKRYFVVPGAHHNDAPSVGGEAYREVWRRFLEETRAPATGNR